MGISSSSNALPGPKVGMIPRELMLEHSGLEVLRLFLTGELAGPPISELIPFELIAVEIGEATIRSIPSDRLYNIIGVAHGGYAMTLLDTCMGLAIYSTIRPGIGYTTIETKVNFVRPVTAGVGPLKAIGHALHTGTRTGTAEGRLVGEHGKLYAHGTTTCFLHPL